MVAGRAVERGLTRGDGRRVLRVAGHEQDRRGVAGAQRARRLGQHVEPGGAAVCVLEQPAQAQPEPPGEVDRVVGGERERRHGEPVDVRRRDAGVGEGGGGRLGQERVRGRPRRRVSLVGRLRDAGDDRLAHRRSR